MGDRVCDVAGYIRSKNAGPFWVTLEIFCNDDESFERIANSPNLTAEKVAELYGIEPEKMIRFRLDTLRVIKFSYVRPHPSGWKYENDMHSGQQYVLLAQALV